MSRHTGRLVLTPNDPLAAPSRTGLCAELNRLGLLGQELGGSAHRFHIGAGFLSLISFTGCAVQLTTSPAAGATTGFTHLRLLGPFDQPRLRAGRNTRAPRCPTCRHRLLDWPTCLHPRRSATCPGCQTLHAAADWDWRAQGGIGRLFLDIEEVFPGEAVPTPALMAAIAAFSQSGWHYFYLQDEPL